MKPPYISKLTTIGKHNVYVVDGGYVRKNIAGGKDFTNFGHSHRFGFIPKNEFWVDRGVRANESGYFLDNMLKEHGLMEKGKPFGEAHAAAIKQEKMERMKARVGPRLGEKATPEAKASIPKTAMPQYDQDGLKVFMVDGKAVRDKLFPDFAEGGNDKAYGFIPKGEVWLDDGIDPKEVKPFVTHEITERNLMAKGMPYIAAHKRANEAEHALRMNGEHK